MRILADLRRLRRPKPRKMPIHREFLPVPPLLIVAIMLLVGLIGAVVFFEWQLRPLVTTLAEAQAVSRFTEVIDEAILADLAQRGSGYSDFVTIQRDSQGNIQALTTNMAEMNLLRAQLEDRVFECLGEIELSTVSVPVGSLFGSDLLWGRGPFLELQSLTIGILNSEFISEFTEAGINQTRHRIYLDIQVPITLLIAGGTVQTELSTYLCVAETVIVGSVPNSYLQF